MMQSIQTKYKTLTNVLIILFILSQILLGTRALITNEKYFGWGMFADAFYLRIRVYGYDATNKEHKISQKIYRPWVRGRAYGHLRQRKGFGLYLWGRGLMERELDVFGQELCARSPTHKYKKIHVVYRIMPISSDYDESEVYRKEFLCYE